MFVKLFKSLNLRPSLSSSFFLALSFSFWPNSFYLVFVVFFLMWTLFFRYTLFINFVSAHFQVSLNDFQRRRKNFEKQRNPPTFTNYMVILTKKKSCSHEWNNRKKSYFNENVTSSRFVCCFIETIYVYEVALCWVSTWWCNHEYINNKHLSKYSRFRLF